MKAIGPKWWPWRWEQNFDYLVWEIWLPFAREYLCVYHEWLVEYAECPRTMWFVQNLPHASLALGFLTVAFGTFLDSKKIKKGAIPN